MFASNDEKYIKRLIGRNEVVLFLGSGFSRDAKNKLNEDFPTGSVLCEKIWNFLGYPGAYDVNSQLPEMYQAFVSSSIKKDLKKQFLESQLLSGDVPIIYNSISIPFWFKIYTVNIDDVVTKIFRRNKKGIRELKFPIDEYAERDQSLESTQVVYLHGKLPCSPEDVIFSSKQYASATLKEQALYSHFVYDYAVLPTIFVGTELNEPLFDRYIESRKGKGGYAERRPKSFLITPSINPAKRDILKNQYNIHHISGKTEDFLRWIDSIKDNLPTKEEILRDTFPSFATFSELSTLKNVSQRSIKEFAHTFKRVPKEIVLKSERSAYLSGANPTWQDLFKDLDIPRTITTEIQLKIEELYTKNDCQNIITISGTAGSGKSTIAKRLGLIMSQSGKTVFISDSEVIAKPEYITDVLNEIKEKTILIFDNAKNIISHLSRIVDAFSKLDFIPIIILSIRSNQYDKLNSNIDPTIIDHYIYSVPNLDDTEIVNLVSKLDEYNLLGKLKGLSNKDRINEFKNKAKKQILVAMKEATNGKPFEDIIRDEYTEIEPREARLLCLCVALCTETGFSNSKQDFVSFSEVDYSDALEYLNNNLNGIVTQVGDNNTRLMLRHRILADYIIASCTTLEDLKCAYIRVLSSLSSMINSSQYSALNYRLYLSLINHKVLYRRFKNDINRARSVFDSITSFFTDNPLFWLQYGSLELEGEGGDLSLAENYLLQAESLDRYNQFIQNAKCLLYYKKSINETNFLVAKEYKLLADELAVSLFESEGKDDAHLYHIYCIGCYKFIDKWIFDIEEKKRELTTLKKFSEKAMTLFSRDKEIEKIANDITRAYITLGISK